MFEDATFHSSGILPNQTPKWMLLTLAVNLTAVAALIVLPLVYPQALPTQFLQRILYMPPAEPTVVKPRILTQPATQSSLPTINLFNAPTHIPTLIPIDPILSQGDVPRSDDMDLSHLSEGVSGSTNPSTDVFQRTKPVVVKPAPEHPLHISTGVLEGMILSKANPTYPIIARTAGISGTVVLAALISTTGRIENLQVVSGPLMLRQAALDAVKTWRYSPYLLNNQPVEVETTIYVAFTLGSR
jgi:periplasmic protein TonB